MRTRKTPLSPSSRTLTLADRTPRRWPALLAVLAVLLSGLVAAGSASPAAAEETQISEGSLNWGVRESFRTYIPSIAHGTITVSGGATLGADGIPVFPVTNGSYDDETSTTIVQFGGSVRFWGHSGALDMTIADPRVEIGATGAVLYATVDSTPLDGGDGHYGDIAFANLDVTAGRLNIDGGVTSWSNIPANLSEAGTPAFSSFYPVGAELDPVSFAYTGPGGGPVEPTETWDEPGALGYEVLTDKNYEGNVTTRPITLSADGTALLIVRGVSAAGWGGSISYVVEAVDAQSLEPLDTGVTFSTEQVPTSAQYFTADRSTDTVYFGRSQITAVRWDRATGEYTTEHIGGDDAPALTSIIFDEVSDRLLGLLTGGRGLVSYERDDEGHWQQTIIRYGENGVADFGGRITQLRVTTDGTIIGSRGGTNNAATTLAITLEPDGAVIDEIPGTISSVTGNGYAFSQPDAHGGFYLVETVGSPGFIHLSRSSGTYAVDSERTAFTGATSTSTAGTSNYDAASDTFYLAGSTESTGVRVIVGGENLGLIPSASAAAGYVVAAPDGVFYRQGALGAIQRVQVLGTVPTIDSHPVSQQVDVPTGTTGTEASFSVEASGDEVTYQWQSRPAGATSVLAWSDIEGATSADLTFDATAAENGTQYRVIVGNTAGRLASDVAVLTVRTTPSVLAAPVSRTVVAGDSATFTVFAGGNPYPDIAWQRRVGGFWQNIDPGDENFVVDGASLTVKDTNPEQSGSVFRAKLSNGVGQAVYSKNATLTVNPAVTIPEDGLSLEGVEFEWSGSAELQKRAPNGQANPFVAGVSDGTEATYKVAEGDVSIVHVAGDGSESTPTWATRDAQTTGEVTQVVQLAGGEAKVEADGSAVVEWDGSWSVNFYGPLVPFTFTDPVLTVDKDGTGTLKADLSGYASSMENPEVKEPLAPRGDVVIATFDGVEIDPAGKVTIMPDYAGVEVETGDATPQNRSATGWGAWPQPFVDFHLATGLSSYWYSSGGAADPYKAPSPLTVDFTDAEQIDGPTVEAPLINTQPADVSAVVGGDVELTVSATGEGLGYRWQKRIGSLWIDIPDETTATLKLADVVAEDAGRYRVRVTNTAGTVVSDVAAVTIAKQATQLTVSAPSSRTYGKAVTVKVAVPDRTGKIALTGAGTARSASIVNGVATFSLPKTLAAKAYTLRASFTGDATYASATGSTKLTVKRANVSFRSVKVTKKPTSKKAGKATVQVRSATGVVVSGKVRVTLTKGKATKRVTVTVKNGKATVKLPKLAKGTWRVQATSLRSTNFNSKTKTIKVKVTK